MELKECFSFNNISKFNINPNYIQTKNVMAQRILEQQDEINYLNQMVFYLQINTLNTLKEKEAFTLELNNLVINDAKFIFIEEEVSEEEKELLHELKSLKDENTHLQFRINKLSTDKYLLKNELKELINSIKQVNLKDLNEFARRNSIISEDSLELNARRRTTSYTRAENDLKMIDIDMYSQLISELERENKVECFSQL